MTNVSLLNRSGSPRCSIDVVIGRVHFIFPRRIPAPSSCNTSLRAYTYVRCFSMYFSTFPGICECPKFLKPFSIHLFSYTKTISSVGHFLTGCYFILVQLATRDVDHTYNGLLETFCGIFRFRVVVCVAYVSKVKCAKYCTGKNRTRNICNRPSQTPANQLTATDNSNNQ